MGKSSVFGWSNLFIKKSQTGHKYWNCVCKCGVKKQIREYPLLRSQTKSCGCISRALCYARNFRHGHARTYNHGPSATYQCWLSMRSRCLNPTHKAYSYYGGRGINVCDRWMKFENFFDDMGEKPNGLSLDRINNDLGYFKENCRWATDNEQGENRRNTRRIFHQGQRVDWPGFWHLWHSAPYHRCPRPARDFWPISITGRERASTTLIIKLSFTFINPFACQTINFGLFTLSRFPIKFTWKTST